MAFRSHVDGLLQLLPLWGIPRTHDSHVPRHRTLHDLSISMHIPRRCLHGACQERTSMYCHVPFSRTRVSCVRRGCAACGKWSIMYTSSLALVTFSRLSSGSFDLWVGRATCASFYTAVWSVYFFFPLLTWLFPSLCVYDLRCSCFSLRAVNAGQPRARDGESEFCPTLRFACSVYLQFSPSAFKVLYILSKYRKWNYGGSKFICSLCIEISAAAFFSRLSD